MDAKDLTIKRMNGLCSEDGEDGFRLRLREGKYIVQESVNDGQQWLAFHTKTKILGIIKIVKFETISDALEAIEKRKNQKEG